MADYGDEIETKNESFTEKMKIHDDDSSFSSDLDSEKKKKHDEDVKKLHDAPLPSSSMKWKKPVHKLLGGGKPADVFLWRNKKISASVLGVATASWVLFELLDYHLVTLVCHILMLVFAILFLWSNASKFINKSPPSIPEVRVPEDTFRQGATALRTEINRFLDIMRDIASGRELKKFITVVVGLWVLSIVGSWCDFLTLFYITFVILHTIPVLYEKYKEQVDAFAEKATIEIKRSYAVFDDKVVSKIPKGPLKGKKRA